MPRKRLGLSFGLFMTCSLLSEGWEPGSGHADATGSAPHPFLVDSTDRNDVLSFYHCIYGRSEGYQDRLGWTGSLTDCQPGTTSQAFRNDVQTRVNYFRAMAGIPGDIEFSESFNEAAQAAALIMAFEQQLSHTPGIDFGEGGCWTPEGENGANHGNLALGSFGPGAIDGYLRDPGDENLKVGHRRLILHPNTTTMGTGDIPGGSAAQPANCLFVIDRPSERPSSKTFVSWPPPGYVPRNLVFPRWSLQFNSSVSGYPRFGSAQVSMREISTDTSIPAQIVDRSTGGLAPGDPAIVWEPDWSAFGGSAPVESEIEVTVSGITPGDSSAPTSWTYRITAIDPNVITDDPAITGPEEIPLTGASFVFTPVSGIGADDYELSISRPEPVTWVEGAESLDQIIDQTAGSYDLSTKLVYTYGSPAAYQGSQAFQLAFDSFDNLDEKFEIDRTVVASEDTALNFYELFRWSSEVSELSAEISADGGPWTKVWSKNGNDATNTDGWVKSWTARNIALGTYAGQSLRVRFRYRLSETGGVFLGTDGTFGAFIDQVSFSNATILGAPVVSPLPDGATSFVLNETTAGGPLKDGDHLFLSLRATVGCSTIDFGGKTAITADADAVYGFEAWMGAEHPDTSPAGFFDDPDRDGVSNGLEYAFGLHPGHPDTLPGLKTSGDAHKLSFDPTSLAYDTSSLIYGALFSTDLEKWTPLNDADDGPGLTFEVPVGPRGFVRWSVTKK